MKIDEVTFDFNAALGDTIKEKYEAFYIFLVRETSRLTSGDIVMLRGSKEAMWIFEFSYPHQGSPFYVNAIYKYLGNLNNRWELWEDSTLLMNELYLETNNEFIKITVDNFLI